MRLRLRAHRPGDMGWIVERHGALYAGLGFRLVKKERHRRFGVPVVGETWELELRRPLTRPSRGT